MSNSDPIANKKILREAQIGFAVAVVLFCILVYFSYDKMFSRWSLKSDPFAEIQQAIEIPVENLAIVRHPGYVLPQTQEQALMRQDLEVPVMARNARGVAEHVSPEPLTRPMPQSFHDVVQSEIESSPAESAIRKNVADPSTPEREATDSEFTQRLGNAFSKKQESEDPGLVAKAEAEKKERSDRELDMSMYPDVAFASNESAEREQGDAFQKSHRGSAQFAGSESSSVKPQFDQDFSQPVAQSRPNDFEFPIATENFPANIKEKTEFDPGSLQGQTSEVNPSEPTKDEFSIRSLSPRASTSGETPNASTNIPSKIIDPVDSAINSLRDSMMEPSQAEEIGEFAGAKRAAADGNPSSAHSVLETDSNFQPRFPQHDRVLAPTVIQQDKLSEKPNFAPVVYRTRQNEDLWSIAEKVYGSGRYFRALHECNVDRLNGLDNLPEGLELICPPLEELVVLHRAAIPDDLLRITSGQDKIAAGRPSVAQTKYTVRAQDSLFSIARDQLGQASRYLEIIELNAPLLNPRITHLDPLEPGMELKLPARKK